MSTTTQAPDKIQGRKVEARILRQKVWRRANVKNQHFMGAIVGREGSGKSYTAVKISELCDPTFNADRVMFDPASFLEQLQEWKEKGETQGKAVILDEAGVGVGVRSWYDKEQIKFNKVLQTIRDENMIAWFTLPRLSELDSQTRGRLHAFLEMVDMEPDEWAELKWKNIDPARDDRDNIYKKYPRLRINGEIRPVKRLRFGPPTQELIDNYEGRKNTFQEELYQDAIDEMNGEDEDDGVDTKSLANTIVENKLTEYVSIHNGNKMKYVDKELLRADYELSLNEAKAVKRMIEREVDVSEVDL